MKTALQELIEKWENETGSYIPNAPIYKAFIEESKSYLEKEKQQINEAYKEGWKNPAKFREHGSSSYYNSAFGDNPEAGI